MPRPWLCFLPILALAGCARHQPPMTMDTFAAPLPTEISSFKSHLETGLTMMGSMGGPSVSTTMYAVDLPYDQTIATLRPLLDQSGWKSLGVTERKKKGAISETFMKGDIEKLEIQQDRDPDTNAVEVTLVHVSPFTPKPSPPRNYGHRRLF